MVILKASPGEILRASQKDEFSLQKLKSLATEAIIGLGGTRLFVQYKGVIESVAYFLYYGSTTLLNLQTLGEEYSGIIQVKPNHRAIPSFLARLLMMIFDCFGEKVAMRALNHFERQVRENPNLTREGRRVLLVLVKIARSSIPFLTHLHRAVFYWSGSFYHIAKRATGINYVLTHYWNQDLSSTHGFKLLGIISSLHLFGSALYSILADKELVLRENVRDDESKEETEGVRSQFKCPLCLELIRNTSCIPCGHLFCWDCILKWIDLQSQCPVCREPVQHSRVVPLMNYY